MRNSETRCYSIRHDSCLEYDEPAQGSVTLTRLYPRYDRGQHVRSFSIETEPAATPVTCDDSFSNRCHVFSIYGNSRNTHVRSRSVVETTCGPDLEALPGAISWDDLDRQALRVPLWHYLAPSRFVHPSEALEEFTEKSGLKRGADPFSTLKDTCTELHSRFVYEPGTTTVDSTLECILKQGKGVCQDYTHVMLALGRIWGVPSRYVSGYLYLDGSADKQSSEVASHAWPEFWLPEIGWVGFDPTNDSVADNRYIRVAHGRDYSDAAPTRGVVFGGGKATVSVSVRMRIVEDEASPDESLTTSEDLSRETARPWRQPAGQSYIQQRDDPISDQ